MILLDPRVGSNHLAPIFTAMKVPFEISSLEFGDCAFLGNGPDGPVRVGIEIKGGRGGSDFLQSMQSGRLVGHQVPGLAEAYERRYLVIEGLRPTRKGVLWTPPRRGGRARPIFMADVHRFVTGLEESGLRIRYTRDPEHTARVIAKELLGFWEKDYHSHTSISVLYQAPIFTLHREDETTMRIRRVVKALKAGIGDGRSKAVAHHFGSIDALVNAEEAAWTGIEGVGKKTIGEAIRVIREVIPGFKSKTGTAVRPSKADVPPRTRRAAGSSRAASQREGSRVDAGTSAKRNLRKAGIRRAVPDRHQPKRRNQRSASSRKAVE